MNRTGNILGVFAAFGLGVAGASGAIADLQRTDFPAGVGPTGMTSADFNSDGIGDLAIADSVGNAVAVLFGNPEGGYEMPVMYSAPVGMSEVFSIVAGDLNADGAIDLAATIRYAGVSQSRVMILTNLGDGTFSHAEYLTGYGPTAIDIGDMDGDGDLDLITANYSSRSMTRLYNDGEGGFDVYAQSITQRYPRDVRLGDLDGDGDLDIALSSNYGLSIYKVDASGAIISNQLYYAGTRPNAIAVGDLDGDHRDDLVVADLVAARVAVFTNVGSGDFASPVFVPVAIGPSDLVLSDMNDDGALDLLLTAQSSNLIELKLNDKLGGFGDSQTRNTGLKPLALLVEDLNNDGLLDLASANMDSNTVSVFTTQGCGGDFNHDGSLDFFDVSAFINAFGTRDPSADLNADGAFNFFDVSAFIALYSAGCP